MTKIQIAPLTETADTVTLRRDDFEALLERIEDVQDMADSRAVMAKIASGEEEAIPVEMVERLLDGEAPIKVWREYRGLKARELAERADVATAYLSEIENGKKPGSAEALSRIARVLGVDIEDLLLKPNRD